MSKYYVYVIELDPKVADLRKFRAKNPKYIKGNGCVYVGQSSKKPEVRFEQHKEGYKSNKYAKYYGIKLRPDIYEKYNPIPSRKDFHTPLPRANASSLPITIQFVIISPINIDNSL